MNTYEFISSLIKTLVWPSLILFIYISSKDAISERIRGLLNVKYNQLEINFTKLEQFNEKVEKQSGSTLEIPPMDESVLTNVVNSPYETLILSWIEVEKHLKLVAKSNNIISKSSILLASELERKEILDKNTVDAIHILRRTRNKLVHNPEFKLDEDSVLQYKNAAEIVIYRLKQKYPSN